MKKLVFVLVSSILIVGTMIMNVAACGAILGEDKVPESLR